MSLCLKNVFLSLNEAGSVIRPDPKNLEGLFVLWELFKIPFCERLLYLRFIGRINECDTCTLESCARESPSVNPWKSLHDVIDRNQFRRAAFVIMD